MAKLYFKYGAMGSSKSAQALITQFNYEELGMTVWLIKPSIDDRDGANIVKSRVGLMREAEVVSPTDSIRELYSATGGRDVIIADEAQFFTPEQIDELPILPADYVVNKRRYSGFFQTDLDLTLRDMGCEKVIVGGAVTNICVRGTVADAFQLDYEVFVPKDCVRATSEREQESQLWDFETHFATVCTSEELIAAMDTLEPGDECRIR